MGQRPVDPVPVALCLGGFDPSGGAGLLRDALAVAAFGIHPMAVPTAETLQNGEACLRITPPHEDPVERLLSLRPHLNGSWGVKVGMLALAPPDMARLGRLLGELAPSVRIWDPILAPSHGSSLHQGSDLLRFAEQLLPVGGWVVSPNLPEARAAAEARGCSESLAAPFLELGANAVWLKGGHADGETIQDLWITPAGTTHLQPAPRLPGTRRGTGCALAAAWLSLRLLGREELEAAEAAAAWLRECWSRAVLPGGFGRPVLPPGGAA